MLGKQYLLIKQLVTSAALALGVSGVALADDSGQNRGNLNMRAQNPCLQGTESAGARPKKDEQKIESKIQPPSRGTPITSPTYFNQYPGQ
jgi:hypothetical protein